VQHWLHLIQPYSTNFLTIDAFEEESCQLLYSIASACSVPAKKHGVVG